MADIARHAEVSRATLYRRWPNVQSVVAALMTREWTIAGAAAFVPGADARSSAGRGCGRGGRPDPDAPADAQDHRARPGVPHAVPVRAPRQQHRRRTWSWSSRRCRRRYEDGSIRLGDPELAGPDRSCWPRSPRRCRGRSWPSRTSTDRLDEELRQMLDQVPDAMNLRGQLGAERDPPGAGAGMARRRRPGRLLVVGGGVTGAGVALDAASRGLSVALAEKHDLAFGTSRWSSKLVHGGLRYLAAGQVGIAYESAVERGILMQHTAPHLVHPVPHRRAVVAEGKHQPGGAAARGVRSAATCSGWPPRTSGQTAAAFAPDQQRRGAPVRADACDPTGCAAASSTGTASCTTTPGWWSRSRAPRPRTAPGS